jgi:hypothetical protein
MKPCAGTLVMRNVLVREQRIIVSYAPARSQAAAKRNGEAVAAWGENRDVVTPP